MKYILNYEVTGCPNRCRHCYCVDLKSKRCLIDKETLIEHSKAFKEKISSDLEVWLLQEQTMYPDFLDLTKELRKEGLQQDKRGMLVTNGFGLSHGDLLSKISPYFSSIKMTLFGTQAYHDDFVKRTGHFSEILKVTKEAEKYDLDVIWQLMYTRGQSQDIKTLIDYCQKEDIKHFVTSEFYYQGQTISDDSFIPLEDDFKDIDFQVYESQNGIYLPEREFKSLEVVDEMSIDKVSLKNLYITPELDVYPLNCQEEAYLLGSMKDLEHLKKHLEDPKSVHAINERLETQLSDLIKDYLDETSNEMHTPQSLFEKLYYKKLGNHEKI